MKKTIISLFAAALITISAAAAMAASATPSVSMLYRSTIQASVQQDLSFKLTRNPSLNGSYYENDLGFRNSWDSRLITPALVAISGDKLTNVDIIFPNTVQLMNGAATATMATIGYGKTTVVTDPRDMFAQRSGGDGFANVTTGDDGKYFLSLTPGALNFDQDLPGNWTGTLPVSVEYSL